MTVEDENHKPRASSEGTAPQEVGVILTIVIGLLGIREAELNWRSRGSSKERMTFV